MTFEAVLKKEGMWTLSSFILAVDALKVGTLVEGPVGAARRQNGSARLSLVRHVWRRFRLGPGLKQRFWFRFRSKSSYVLV